MLYFKLQLVRASTGLLLYFKLQLVRASTWEVQLGRTVIQTFAGRRGDAIFAAL